MGDFIKELNIIDFLGMLLPGSILILVLSIDYSGAAIWSGYFGYSCGDGIKITILLVAGYVLGMLIHEAGHLLEKLFWSCPFLDPVSYAAAKVGKMYPQLFLPNFGKGEVCKYYCPSYKIGSLCKWIKEIKDHKSSIQDVRSENSKIQAELSKASDSRKRQLFEGFHVMMRNLLIVFAVIVGYLCIAAGEKSELKKIVCQWSQHIWFWPVCITVLALMAVRCWHYAYLRYKYSFEDYVQMQQNEKPSKASSSGAQ